jgi:hypothetical protein
MELVLGLPSRTAKPDGIRRVEADGEDGHGDVDELHEDVRAHVSDSIHHSMNSEHLPCSSSRITHRLV